MTQPDTSASDAPQPLLPPDPWREKVMHKCRESVEVKQKFFEHYAGAIGELSQKMAERFREGHQLWVMGNGGSACDAQHVAVEFIHPIIEKRRALPALDLVSQIPVLTAISNDKDFARIFRGPDRPVGKAGRYGAGYFHQWQLTKPDLRIRSCAAQEHADHRFFR